MYKVDTPIPSPPSATSLRQLHPGSVHIWVWQVASSPLQTEELTTLDSREMQRAERFRPALHRAQWVRSHNGMRQILSGYLNCTPGNIVFLRGPNGKPFLHAPNPPKFNLSHSHDWCALAVAHNVELGIDIQVPHPVNPSLWRRVLTPTEKSQMETLKPTDREPAFFRCWTRKEAIGKADSQGVYVHLKRTETGLRPLSDSNVVLTAPNAFGIPTHWHITDLTLPAGLHGAIATAAPVTIELRTLPALAL
jgi:4'-phosphopantetheinyl transferase